MKRSIDCSIDPVNTGGGGQQNKKIREDNNMALEIDIQNPPNQVLQDDNLLYEILKHVDARTLGACGCVNKHWNRTSKDERLWELICTRHWDKIGCGNTQLRSVVLALGGFKRLHSGYLWPLSKPTISSSSGASSSRSTGWPCLPPTNRSLVPSKPITKSAANTRWGKDEVQLSLSLLSIRYYEKMNFNNRK
uniref:F-box protein GID2-like n=1 Tax=Erigeron canadensis TaxID=72917 RepID=UPI001CB9628E|nr:F-box protein GID2-like [Erigeron canadensis]